MPTARPIILLSNGWRLACVLLNLVPLPGLGATIAGWRNPHTPLRSHGIAQMILVVFGSWPLVVPGIAGFAWAAWDAYVIHRDARPAGPLSRPVDEG